MSNKNILLLGGGGHCKSVLDSLLTVNKYDNIGLVDPDKCASLQGVEYVGTDDDLIRLYNEGWNYAFVTLGSVGSTRIRRRLYEQIKSIGFSIPTIIDPTAIIANDAMICDGVFIGKKAVVNSGCTINEGAIINTSAVIEHDCVIGGFSHVSPGAIICGSVDVGNDTHIGAGSVVKQGLVIGDKVMIGAGSVVLKQIDSGLKAYGNPCKVVDL